MFFEDLSAFDPEVGAACARELSRQRRNIELIASENIVSEAVLLAAGGVLIADDVLLFGWASGEAEVPKKRRMLAKHIEEYLVAVTSDPELFTSVIKVGDGIALSVKR